MPVPASDRTRIAAPRPPEPAPPFQFPVIATVAPLIASVVLFAITQSPFTLVFAALGPVIAVASFADSRLGARRTGKRERARFVAELAEVSAEVDRRLDAERDARAEISPSGAAIVARMGADPYRWRSGAAGPVLVTVGDGSVTSGLEVDVPGTASAAGVREQLEALRARAASVQRAAVTVDARLGIGVAGAGPLALAVLRSLAVQLAWALPPTAWSITAAGLAGELDWLAHLPHRIVVRRGGGGRVEFVSDDPGVAGITIARARDAASLPAACRVVLGVSGEGVAIIGHPDRAERRSFRPGVVALADAMTWAPRLAADAAREGMAGTDATLPAAVSLADVVDDGVSDHRATDAHHAPHRPTDPASAGRALPAVFAVGAAGPLVIDLVEHGPHAVVGGTTGSGKSELLVAWVLALAARHGPDRVSFLLVDFKGGSAFAPLESLPHTVGVITDLDEHGALRALESLRAEVRFRERSLAQARARDIADVPGMPRLMIVVDEFAAMLSDHPDLHALFGDLAARGRSLGIHLVLCTQRPAGVVRDAVLANADLRISLRVNNRADSSAVIGTDAAAAIPAAARGRAYVSLAGDDPSPVQAALAAPDDAARLAARWHGAPAPRRPWVEPLPDLVRVDDLAGAAPDEPRTAGIPFGLLDLPHEQRRAVAAWNPAAQGNLLVLGAPGSGKSVALATLAGAARAATGAAAVWLPNAVPAAWDVIADLAGQLDGGAGGAGGARILVADDLDALVARMPGEHRTEFLDRLARVLREGPQHGLASVVAAQRVAGELQAVAALVPARLMLRHASRQDWVLAGADGPAFTDALPSGGGSWLGRRVQVAVGPTPRPADPVASTSKLVPERPIAVVTSRVAAVATRLGHAGFTVLPIAGIADPSAPFGGSPAAGPVAIIGDVDDWQSRWGSIGAVRAVAEIVFDACSPADLRVLTRSRELPPPLERDQVWRLSAAGGVERAVLPG